MCQRLCLGKVQTYCDIEDDMVKGMFGTIVQGYNNFLIVDKNTNILYNVNSLVSCFFRRNSRYKWIP